MPTFMSANRRLTRLVLVVGVALGIVIPAHAVTIDWVTVGNPGNANNTTGYGAVGEAFQIGKYEITIGQYAAFLNAAATSDPYQLYHPSMESNKNIAGIARSGSSGSYIYSVISPFGAVQITQATAAGRPITFVSWFDAARFANWMSNGQPTGSPGPSTTENGAYNLSGVVSGMTVAKNSINPNTNAAPSYFIPTANQWYKSAYYSPALNSGDGGYYLFPTQSNTSPGNTVGGAANQANHMAGKGFAVTQSLDYTNQNMLTDGGAFTGSAGFYGTFDQHGNVYEITSGNGMPSDVTEVWGASWMTADVNATSAQLFFRGTEVASEELGFRLASPVAVPEPSTWAMGLAGLACGGWQVMRRRKRVA